jgi:hypothetical protein
MRRTLLVAAALAACNTGFEPQYRVRDVRLLAVSSSAQGSASADVGPGDTVGLAALVANPRNRPGLTVDWLACLPQASEAIPPCLDQAYLKDPARLLAAVGNVPGVVSLGSSAPDPTGVASVTFPLPDVTAALEFAIAYAAHVNQTFQCRLYAELVVVAIASAEGHTSMAYKRVPIVPTAAQVSAGGATQLYVLNLNPSVGEVRVNPGDPEACTGGDSISAVPFPAGQIEICGRGGDGSIGTYNLCDPAGGTTAAFETLDWQWYVTDGEFPDEGGGVGDARGGHVKFQRPAGAFTLWSIVRDGRGGVAWTRSPFPAL